MKSEQSFISLKEIHSYYRDKCNENGITFLEKDFKKFLNCCESDFYQWLKDNFKYFRSENLFTTDTK